jgi:hypothetical protein
VLEGAWVLPFTGFLLGKKAQRGSAGVLSRVRRHRSVVEEEKSR